MGFKFRKRVKLAPGVHVNLGEKSASLSVGPRGAKLNLGKQGVRTTVGIPGTGISYSQLLKSGQKVQKTDALSYSAYKRLSKEERAAYKAAGGKIPAWAKIMKVVIWGNIIFWGLLVALVALSKS